MMQSFHDLVLGDVLISPIVTYSAIGMVIVRLLRPLLARVAFDRIFSMPPVVMLCLYVLVIALLVVMA
jgi:hypothetical protein